VNPRVEPYAWDEIDRRQLSGYNTVSPTTGIPVIQGDVRVTSANNLPTDDKRVTQQTGEAPYGTNQKPGTDPNAVTYRDVLNVTNNGIGIIRMVLNTTNGMSTGQRVTIRDVTGVPNANGDFVVTVVNTTTIDLQNALFTGAYTGGGYVINNPSLPYGFTEVPKTGPL